MEEISSNFKELLFISSSQMVEDPSKIKSLKNLVYNKILALFKKIIIPHISYNFSFLYIKKLKENIQRYQKSWSDQCFDFSMEKHDIAASSEEVFAITLDFIDKLMQEKIDLASYFQAGDVERADGDFNAISLRHPVFLVALISAVSIKNKMNLYDIVRMFYELSFITSKDNQNEKCHKIALSGFIFLLRFSENKKAMPDSLECTINIDFIKTLAVLPYLGDGKALLDLARFLFSRVSVSKTGIFRRPMKALVSTVLTRVDNYEISLADFFRFYEALEGDKKDFIKYMITSQLPFYARTGTNGYNVIRLLDCYLEDRDFCLQLKYMKKFNERLHSPKFIPQKRNLLEAYVKTVVHNILLRAEYLFSEEGIAAFASKKRTRLESKRVQTIVEIFNQCLAAFFLDINSI